MIEAYKILEGLYVDFRAVQHVQIIGLMCLRNVWFYFSVSYLY